MTETLQPLERFSVLIETYGSDLNRWPVDSQVWARSMLRSSPESAALLREAAALDLVLQRAPTVNSDRAAALADKIVAAAVSSGKLGLRPTAKLQSTSNVVSLPPQRPAARLKASPITPRRRQLMSQGWRAAASLAASLLLGVLIGSYDLAPYTLDTLVDGVGKEQDVELFVTSLGGDGLTPSLDEDYL